MFFPPHYPNENAVAISCCYTGFFIYKENTEFYNYKLDMGYILNLFISLSENTKSLPSPLNNIVGGEISLRHCVPPPLSPSSSTVDYPKNPARISTDFLLPYKDHMVKSRSEE